MKLRNHALFTPVVLFVVAVFSFGAMFLLTVWLMSPNSQVQTMTAQADEISAGDVVTMVGLERGEHIAFKHQVRLNAQLCDQVLVLASSTNPGYLSVLTADGVQINTMSPSDVYPLISHTNHEIGFQARRITEPDRPVVVIIIWTEYFPELDLYPMILDRVAKGETSLTSSDFPEGMGTVEVATHLVDISEDTHGRYDLIDGCTE